MWLVAVALLGRVDRAPGFTLTASLFLLPHFVAAHTLLVFALWTIWPDRRILPVAGGSTLLLGAGLWVSSLASWAVEAPGDVMRVASWNVQRLWGLEEDRERALGCVVDTLSREDPEVLTLLEVSRADVDDLAAALALRCVHAPYYATNDANQGGLAVCARSDLQIRGSRQRFVDSEDWWYAFAEVTRGTQTFNVLAVHLWPYRLGAGRSFTRDVAHGQANQSRALLERVARFNDPTIVAGDFNSTRDFYLHTQLRGLLQDTWEVGGIGFGATKHVKGVVPLRIDYVYATERFQVHDSRVGQVDCSDHRPVITDVSLR